jgi:predicted TIM-barrel fold metal-dependent hydrolase
MRDGLRIIDVDRHVFEPLALWREYLEPEFRAGAPYEGTLDSEGSSPQSALMLDGRPVMHRCSARAQLEVLHRLGRHVESTQAGWLPELQLRAMDRTGVDQCLLFPTLTLFLLAADGLSSKRAAAFARAYNHWLRDYCRLAPERLLPVGVLSLHDPQHAVLELERIARLGWRAVTLLPNPLQGRTLGHPAYEPLWSACAKHSLAVAIHASTHTRLPTAGADRFETRFAQHACSHPMEQMMAFLALLEGGVLERHPSLRFAFLEAGCGWIPYWLWRLDEMLESCSSEVAGNIRMKPSDLFRRQCFVAVEPGEPGLAEVIRFLGPDRLLFGSDFPHADHAPDAIDRAVALRARLSEELARRLLWENPSRFLAPGPPA